MTSPFVTEPDVCVLVIGELNNLDSTARSRAAWVPPNTSPSRSRATWSSRHFAPLIAGPRAGHRARHGVAARSPSPACAAVSARPPSRGANLAYHFGIGTPTAIRAARPQYCTSAPPRCCSNCPARPGPAHGARKPRPHRRTDEHPPRSPASDGSTTRWRLAEQPRAKNAAHTRAAERVDTVNIISSSCDVRSRRCQLFRDLLDQVDQRVLVMEPTLAAPAMRCVLLSGCRTTTPRAVARGSCSTARGTGRQPQQVEDALKIKVDVAIPDLPRDGRQRRHARRTGDGQAGGFRNGIIDIVRQVASASRQPEASALPMVSQVKRGSILRRK